MAKKNLKDNSFETAINIDVIDENQIDIEDQIKDETKRPQFKKVKGKEVSRTLNGMVINNDNLTTKLMNILIDKGICTEKDFK
jgi:hypothetical protein